MVGHNYSSAEVAGFGDKYTRDGHLHLDNPDQACTFSIGETGKRVKGKFTWRDMYEDGSAFKWDPETEDYKQILAFDNRVDQRTAQAFLLQWVSSEDDGREYLDKQKAVKKKNKHEFNTRSWKSEFEKILRPRLQEKYACGNKLYDNLDLNVDLNQFVRTADALRAVCDDKATKEDQGTVTLYQMNEIDNIRLLLQRMPNHADVSVIKDHITTIREKDMERDAKIESILEQLEQEGTNVQNLTVWVRQIGTNYEQLKRTVEQNYQEHKKDHRELKKEHEDLKKKFNAYVLSGVVPEELMEESGKKTPYQPLEDLLTTSAPEDSELLRFETACGEGNTKVSPLVTGKELSTLQGKKWLSDCVITPFLYQLCSGNARAHALDTFFFSIACPSGKFDYKRVKNWTNDIGDIFEELDFLLVPIHKKGSHWAIIVVDMKKKTITSYDSDNDPSGPFLKGVQAFLGEEHKKWRGGKSLPKGPKGWRRVDTYPDIDVPRQANGHDCGVFVCLYAYHKVKKLDFFAEWKDWQSAIDDYKVRAKIGLSLLDS